MDSEINFAKSSLAHDLSYLICVTSSLRRSACLTKRQADFLNLVVQKSRTWWQTLTHARLGCLQSFIYNVELWRRRTLRPLHIFLPLFDDCLGDWRDARLVHVGRLIILLGPKRVRSFTITRVALLIVGRLDTGASFHERGFLRLRPLSQDNTFVVVTQFLRGTGR